MAIFGTHCHKVVPSARKCVIPTLRAKEISQCPNGEHDDTSELDRAIVDSRTWVKLGMLSSDPAVRRAPPLCHRCSNSAVVGFIDLP